MSFNWGKLAPHRPLKPGDPFYVDRPLSPDGEELAKWIEVGQDVIAVVGPVGSGKSTELARAAYRLQRNFVVVQVLLDRLLDMRNVTEENVFFQIAARVADVAHANLRLQLSAGIEQRIAAGAALPPAPGKLTSPDRDLLLNTLREVTQKSSQGALVLLLDGIEKCEAESALRVVRALLDMRDEARVVLVAPFALVLGRGAHELVTSGSRVFSVQGVPVGQDLAGSQEGRSFLREIVRVRLGLPTLPEDLAAILDKAAEASGGVPRSFLQLVQASSSYAALEERETITQRDLDFAIRDSAETLARLLVDGDIEHLCAAEGTSGVEVPEERRLRLLMHGLLLEYRTEQGTVVHPAPLLRGVLELGGAA